MKGPPRLLISDLDRTILTRDHQLPASVIAAFERAREAEFSIALATARSPQGVRPYAEALGAVELCACFNGAWIGNVTGGTPLHSVTIEREHAVKAMTLARAAGVDPMWFTSDGIFVCEMNAIVEREAGITREDLHVAATLDELPGRPAKIMCVAWSPEKQAAFEHLKHALAGRVTAVRSHARLLELGPSEAGKASAAALIAKTLGVEQHDTVAAGDGENDIEMLRQAGFAITVANAVPTIRDFADFVGSSCDDGGLAEGIDWIINRDKRRNPFEEEADA